MLIVVEHGNVHRFLQSFFDVEAFRRLDVLKVDTAKCRLEQLADLDDVVGIMTVDLNIEHVDVGKAFEQHGLAFHDGLTGQRADVA